MRNSRIVALPNARVGIRTEENAADLPNARVGIRTEENAADLPNARVGIRTEEITRHARLEAAADAAMVQHIIMYNC